MVVRARHLLAAASAAVALRIAVACSPAGQGAPPPEAGPPGEAFTACEIQGYVSESDAGLCPEGTCPAFAFDTNGARIPCCTSIVSGPARCVDAAGSGPPDAEQDSEAGEGEDAPGAPEAETDAADAGADGRVDAGVEGAAPDDGATQDAADGE